MTVEGLAQVGYMLSSEEHQAADVVRFANRAEQVGFDDAVISDDFQPWIDAKGQSPSVWSVLGAIATATERIRIGCAVTCPTMRYRPGHRRPGGSDRGDDDARALHGQGRHLPAEVLGR